MSSTSAQSNRNAASLRTPIRRAGSLPRKVLRQVADATYHQVWWPSTATVVYPDHAAQPVWRPDGEAGGTGTYVDPDTGVPLPTWAEALDQLDDELDADPTVGRSMWSGSGGSSTPRACSPAPRRRTS